VSWKTIYVSSRPNHRFERSRVGYRKADAGHRPVGVANRRWRYPCAIRFFRAMQ
jgi:hypothetical protein